MSDEMLHELGSFEPHDAKKILDALDQQGVPFEIEPDQRDVGGEGRTLQSELGMLPPGSKLIVFLPESALPRGQAILAKLFPV